MAHNDKHTSLLQYGINYGGESFKEPIPDPFLLLSPFSNNLFVRLDESWMDGRAGIHNKYLQKNLTLFLT